MRGQYFNTHGEGRSPGLSLVSMLTADPEWAAPNSWQWKWDSALYWSSLIWSKDGLVIADGCDSPDLALGLHSSYSRAEEKRLLVTAGWR